jgi:hypothetical protein
MPDARQDLDLVALDLHPIAAPVPQTAAGELGGELLGSERQARRQAFDDRDETGPVGLAGGEESEHCPGWYR